MNNQAKSTRLAKRLLLGKQKPNKFMILLTWFSIGWSTLCCIFFLLAGIYALIDYNQLKSMDAFKDFTPKYCFLIATLHGLTILSVLIMYRMKSLGFYIYTSISIVMLMMPFFLLNITKFSFLPFIFTFVMIGLYATQLKKMS